MIMMKNQKGDKSHATVFVFLSLLQLQRIQFYVPRFFLVGFWDSPTVQHCVRIGQKGSEAREGDADLQRRILKCLQSVLLL